MSRRHPGYLSPEHVQRLRDIEAKVSRFERARARVLRPLGLDGLVQALDHSGRGAAGVPGVGDITSADLREYHDARRALLSTEESVEDIRWLLDLATAQVSS